MTQHTELPADHVCRCAVCQKDLTPAHERSHPYHVGVELGDSHHCVVTLDGQPSLRAYEAHAVQGWVKRYVDPTHACQTCRQAGRPDAMGCAEQVYGSVIVTWTGHGDQPPA